jgi:hypothetical protein
LLLISPFGTSGDEARARQSRPELAVMRRFHVNPGGPGRDRTCPFPRNQLAAPLENRIRRDNRGNIGEDPAADTLTDDGEAPSWSSFNRSRRACGCRFQHAILFP